MRVLASGVDPDLRFSDTGEDRPEGLHLSDILSRMAWERDRKYNPEAPKDLMVFECGHTWETVLARALAERHQERAGARPAPIQEDGIWLSPDWVGPDGHEEWKATKKSIKSIDDKVAEWGPQSKSYVRALLRRKLVKRPTTTFRIWFIMGDWSFESKGDLSLLRDYIKHDVEWSQRELDEGWAGILSFARRTGMLQEEKKPWDDRPRLNQRMTERARTSGSRPAPSRAKAPVVTFPSGRRPSRSNAGS